MTAMDGTAALVFGLFAYTGFFAVLATKIYRAQHGIKKVRNAQLAELERRGLI